MVDRKPGELPLKTTLEDFHESLALWKQNIKT